MSKIPIYTIGYGKRSIEAFIALLQQYQIQFLIDVRSRPYSRFNPQFSAEKNPTLSHLKPSTRTVSIRLPESLIAELKTLANKKDVPYQSLVKNFLAEKVKEETAAYIPPSSS